MLSLQYCISLSRLAPVTTPGGTTPSNPIFKIFKIKYIVNYILIVKSSLDAKNSKSTRKLTLQ